MRVFQGISGYFRVHEVGSSGIFFSYIGLLSPNFSYESVRSGRGPQNLVANGANPIPFVSDKLSLAA